MKCPICNKHETVGKLFEVIRSRSVIGSYFCSHCSIEFRAQGDKVLSMGKVKENGNLKKIC